MDGIRSCYRKSAENKLPPRSSVCVIMYYPAAEAALVTVYKYIHILSLAGISVIIGLRNLLRPNAAEEKKTHQGKTKERQKKGTF